MSIRERLESEVKQAMKARDSRRVGVIRMLKSKLLEQEVALRAREGKEYRISDDEALKVIAGYAKQRRDSIESYRKGGRDDLADAEQAELEIVSEYLPEQLSEEDVRRIVKEAIAGCGATGVKDLGAVMKAAMPRLGGQADGKLVNRIARSLLS